VSVPPLESLARLAVALLVGLLVGLDRERAELRKARPEFAGVRTFPLIALAGAIPMLLEPPWAVVLGMTAFVAVAAITVVSYLRSSAGGDIGATTEIAAVATFLLGALAGAGQLLVAAAAGVAVAVLLVAKPRLEAFSRALTSEELAATLELAVITVIVLPLLPDRGFGPWGVLNPRTLWTVVVLVAGLSFLGFIAVRVLGERRGLALTGAVGGLVSSTAVTMAMADRSRAGEPSVQRQAAAAAVLASTVMAARVGVLAGAVNRGILSRLLPVVAAMMATGVLAAWLIARRQEAGRAGGGERIRNPFSLREALMWAAVYAVVLLVSRAATEYLQAAMIFVVAAVSAIADVDAVTIAFTQLGAHDLAWRMPAAAIALAAVINTLVKLGIAWVRGAPTFRRLMAAALGAMAAVGAGTGAAVYLR
jgi:uncharacterized membrane protein (DUF4010 family)